MHIKKLSDEVINQIAAGEVLERPAHLVKELVENSLDAGATEIEVDYAQGGRFVRIKDNGQGMGIEDLKLCLERHATSKIQDSSDLWTINSYGFRGEALASVAAVSRVKIKSQRQGEDAGAFIESEFGKISKPKPIGGEAGTEVLVSELFENVPARLKFLKSDSAEHLQIKNIIKSMAMVSPKVKFRVKQDGQLIYYWPEDTLRNRVQLVLEQPEMFENRSEVEAYRAHVIACSPNEVSGQSRNIWIFVNGRPVQDRSLQMAVIESYRQLLMHKEYPIAAVFLTCDPNELDVNVHPTKSQVKFRQPSLAFKAVHRALREMLEQAPWVKNLIPKQPRSISQENSSSSEVQQGYSSTEKNRDYMSFQEPQMERTQYSVRESVGNYAPTSGIVEKVEIQSWVGSLKEASGYWSRLHVIGQANLTYIVAQTDQSVLFVDQHAAHERVVFERLMKSYKDKSLDVQSFLIPISFDIEESHLDGLEKYFDELKGMGLEMDRIGPQSLAVRSAPSFLKEKGIEKSIQKMAVEVAESGGSFALEKEIAEVFATMACHSVVRAGQSMSIAQMRELLAQMDEFPLSSFCPHGRPVYVEYKFSELEKDFGRIV